MPTRDKPHTFSHWTVPVKRGEFTGKQFLLIDWLDRYITYNQKMGGPSFTTLVSQDYDRLVQEGIDTSSNSWENSCVFGRIGGEMLIFHQDSLDLEHSRGKAP